ncbi:MAG: hypothetical protein MI799_18095 [Desulfobacterales bacterium]|nr:hypothetical protein [Desulfobacterales bacterium]
MYKISSLLRIGLIYSFLFCLAPSVFADGLVVDQNGQVGVGTDSPDSILHVSGTADQYSNSQIHIDGESHNAPGILRITGGGNGYIESAVVSSSKNAYRGAGLYIENQADSYESTWFMGNAYGPAQHFQIGYTDDKMAESGEGMSAASPSNSKMVINHEGKVGIGTTEPLSALHVDGSVITGSGRGSTTHNVLNYFTNQETTHHVHIKTPFNPNIRSQMFHLKVRGYAYRAQQIIDLTFAGYAYFATKTLRYPVTLDPSGALNPVAYKGSDGYIYLRFTPANTYYITLAVDSMYVGNGKILKAGDITEVILSSSAEL